MPLASLVILPALTALFALALGLPSRAPALESSIFSSWTPGDFVASAFFLDSLPSPFNLVAVEIEADQDFAGRTLEFRVYDDSNAILASRIDTFFTDSPAVQFVDPVLGPPLGGATVADLTTFLDGTAKVSVHLLVGAPINVTGLRMRFGRASPSGGSVSGPLTGMQSIGFNVLPDIPEGLDNDNDSVVNFFDNCDETPNPGQENSNSAPPGDACDCPCYGELNLTSLPVTVCADLPWFPYRMIYSAGIPVFQDVSFWGCRGYLPPSNIYRPVNPSQRQQCLDYLEDWLSTQNACGFQD